MIKPFEDMDQDEQRRMILDDIGLDLPRTFSQWNDLGFAPMKGEHGKRNKWGMVTFTFDQVIPILSTQSEMR